MSVFTIQKKFPDFSLLMDQMFSDKACLPHLLPCFVMQCLEPQEREIVSAYLTQRRLVPKNIDLTDEATLKEYIRYALGPKDIDLTAPDALRESGAVRWISLGASAYLMYSLRVASTTGDKISFLCHAILMGS